MCQIKNLLHDFLEMTKIDLDAFNFNEGLGSILFNKMQIVHKDELIIPFLDTTSNRQTQKYGESTNLLDSTALYNN